MSVITAKRYAHGWTISADKMTTIGTKETSTNKLFCFPKFHLIIGGAGSAYVIKKFVRSCATQLPDASTVNIDLIETIWTDMLESQNIAANDQCPDIFVLLNGELYLSDFNSFDKIVSSFWAIGCGDHFALTALHLGLSATEAVKETEYFCTYVDGEPTTYTMLNSGKILIGEATSEEDAEQLHDVATDISYEDQAIIYYST